MRLDGSLRDIEIAGDLLIGTAGNDAFQDTEFSRRELLPADSFGELFRYGCRDARFAAVYNADGGEQLFDRHTLQQVGLGSGLQRAKDVLIAVECGENDEAGSRIAGAQLRDDVRATKLWEAQIHQRNVWPQRVKAIDRFETVAGFADDLDLRTCL